MVRVQLFWLCFIFFHILQRNIDLFTQSKYSLIIGITSSQEHFEKRNLLRNTWLKPLAESTQVVYYFLIGKYSCLVPPEDRLFVEDCFDWSASFYDLYSKWDNTFSCGMEELDGKNNVSFEGQLISEFIFITAFDVNLVAVGILSSVIGSNHEPLSVKLYNGKNSMILTTIFSQSFVTEYYSTWILINPLFLPKGFEGRIRVEGARGTLYLNSTECYLRDNKSRASIAHILHPVSTDACYLTGFKYVLNDSNTFKEYIEKRPNRHKSWLKNVRHLNLKLDAEALRFNDVLTLNIIDVYRNLPQKILSFFDWIVCNKAFEFVLKTDDDTVINIKNVMSELEHTMEHGILWDWWSCFRSKWPVMDVGKWREYNYKSHTYPEFPTGSGYILRNSMVSYLSKNYHLLYKHFQGEDVSVGIWLSPILPVKHRGKFCHWACNDLYQIHSCNVANLDVSEFKRHWDYFNGS